MARLIQWLGAQLDGGLSLAAVIYVLVLTVSAIGGLVALTADRMLIAATLLTISTLQLSLLTLVAVRTDSTRKLTRQEMSAAWAKAPLFLKVSVYLLVGGHVAELLVHSVVGSAHSGFLGFAGTAAGSFVFGRGVALHRPPLPLPGAEPLTYEAAPIQYQRHVSSIKAASFVVAALFSALALWNLYR